MRRLAMSKIPPHFEEAFAELFEARDEFVAGGHGGVLLKAGDYTSKKIK